MAMEMMSTVRVQRELDGETWVVVVLFNSWTRGPQYDEAPAVVSRDGELIVDAKWGNNCGGEPRDRALIENGALWAPGVVGLRLRTSQALAMLTVDVQRAVVKQREEEAGREADAALWTSFAAEHGAGAIAAAAP